MLAKILSTLSMGGGLFWSFLPFFLCIRLCTNLNEVSVEQLFFILLHLPSETSSNDRMHRLPDSECGENGLKKSKVCMLLGRWFLYFLCIFTLYYLVSKANSFFCVIL